MALLSYFTIFTSYYYVKWNNWLCFFFFFKKIVSVVFYGNKHQAIIGQIVGRQYILKGHQQLQILWFGFLSVYLVLYSVHREMAVKYIM